MNDDATRAALALSEMSLGEKLERYLARGRPLEKLSDGELLDKWRKGLIEWAKDPASFDGHDTVPGDDAKSEMTAAYRAQRAKLN